MKFFFNHIICVGAVLANGANMAVCAQAVDERRPNILIILTDDAGYNDFGFMGSRDMYTPHIDALSRQGVIFDDAHVAASVSSPSRACLITGRYGHRFGYECNLDTDRDGLPVSEETMADILKRNGYRTAAIGKWHLGYLPEMHPNRRGFDMFYGMLSGHREYFYNETQSDRPGDGRNLLLNGDKVEFDGYLTDNFTDKAVEFIQESDQPFMLYLAYNAVHTPMQATDEDMQKFVGHPRQKLAAMTYALDRGVGRVIESLKASGKFDNTLIFFINDNGGATINQSNNYPFKGFKGTKFEGGQRVPFFLVWNGHVQGGRHFSGLVSSLDILKTSLDAVEIKKTKNELDGVSLLPFLEGRKKGSPHDLLFWRKMDTRAVRSGDYKLIITTGVDSVLYDIKKDPEEMHNLLSEKPEVYTKLRKKLSRWEKGNCVEPLWIENGWGHITNGNHNELMKNRIKTAEDLIKKKKK